MLATLAILGFVLSVIVNVGALTSRWSPPGCFWALAVGSFLVRSSRIRGPKTSRQLPSKGFLEDCSQKGARLDEVFALCAICLNAAIFYVLDPGGSTAFERAPDLWFQ
jgi:hypothetical protein